MGKMNMVPSIFKNRGIASSTSTSTSTTSSWQWPSCNHPKTHSFRGGNNNNNNNGDDIFKTVNSVYFDVGGGHELVNNNNTPESWFTNSSESASFSTVSEDHHQQSGEESLEMVIRGLRSERLFFEPGTDSNSILEEAKGSSSSDGFRFKESVVLAMESENPYVDFRNSMEEMVEAHGLKDWECLEELLSWYLKANGKNNHGFIVGAFVDLLVSIAASSSSSDDHCAANANANSSSSSSSSSTSNTSFSPSLSSIFQDPDEVEDIEKGSSSCLEISEI